MEEEIKIGDEFTLHDRKRDVNFNRIGGLKIKVLSIEKGKTLSIAEVEILSLGTKVKIVL